MIDKIVPEYGIERLIYEVNSVMFAARIERRSSRCMVVIN